MRIYPVFLPRGGCPHHCLFCRQEGAGEAALPDSEQVRLLLEECLPAEGDGEIAFYGGTFTLLPQPFQKELLDAAVSNVAAGRVSGVRISTRPDALGEGVVARLRDSGVTTVEIGCQSFSDVVLWRSQRGHGAHEAEGAVSRLRRWGMRVGLQLMPGLPGGDRDEALASLDAAVALKPDFLRIYPAVVFRETPLKTLWRRGEFSPLVLDEAVEICAEALRRCRRVGVPVIRMGLQGTPALEQEMLSGPWHPAFGQLVRSRLWLRTLEEGAAQTGALTVSVHPSDLGDVLGHRRENLSRLREKFGHLAIVPEPATPRGEAVFGDRRFIF